jgi:uncharacterized protein (UPF0262 family)
MEDWKLEIKKVTNGYIVKGKFNDSKIANEVVIEEEEQSKSELLAMQQLLFLVKDYFACYNSKHNKENLIIEIEKNEEKK